MRLHQQVQELLQEELLDQFVKFGIQDVVAKSLGSSNPHNVLKACVNGLKSQNSPKILSSIRGKQISEIISKRETK